MTHSPGVPTNIVLHQQSKSLEVVFANGECFHLLCEYLRISSPSAEVRGHGGEARKPVTGKENVNIVSIVPVGNYGIKPIFDDGHATGIFTWEELYRLGHEYKEREKK